jgi:hypothetical protein
VLGVVYAPTYPDDNGDLFAWAEGCGPVVRNGKPVTTSLADKNLNGSDDVPAIVYISQDADKNPAGNAACVAPARFIAMPSIAYRLALVAAGEGVAAISLNGPGDWDYAGGHAVLVGVGGTLIDQAGSPSPTVPAAKVTANGVSAGHPRRPMPCISGTGAAFSARERGLPGHLPSSGPNVAPPCLTRTNSPAPKAACWASWPAIHWADWWSSAPRPRSSRSIPAACGT